VGEESRGRNLAPTALGWSRKDATGHDRSRAAAGVCLQQPSQPFRLNEHVIVDEDYDVAARGLQPYVPGTTQTDGRRA
jgi:hypothetical protein